MEEKVTRHNIVEHLINKELAYVGKTIEDIKDDPEWYRNNTMTESQHAEWKEYSIKTLKKVLKYPKKLIDREFGMLDLMYGLKIVKDNGDEREISDIVKK